MIVTTAAGATDTGFSGTQQPIIQNLGPGVLYVGTSATSLTTTGLYLPVGAVYEFPATVIEGAGSVWIQASGDECDVRIINVG
jgi:hypothetical protein